MIPAFQDSKFDPRLETDHVRCAQDNRVDSNAANRNTADCGTGVNVDPTNVSPQRAALADRNIDTCMRRDAPGIVKADGHASENTGSLLIKEMSVVDADADEWRDIRTVHKVVLQRQCRRQMLGFDDISRAKQFHIVFKRPRCEQFQSNPVSDKILKGDDWADIIIDAGKTGSRCGEVISRQDASDAKAKQNVTFGLRLHGGGHKRQGSGEDQSEQMFHDVSFCQCVEETLPHDRVIFFDLAQGFIGTSSGCGFCATVIIHNVRRVKSVGAIE